MPSRSELVIGSLRFFACSDDQREHLLALAPGHVFQARADQVGAERTARGAAARAEMPRSGHAVLGYVEGLEITSLVGMVDPPRAESKQSVKDAQKAHIRVRMVTGDDVIAGSAIAKELGIEGESILGAEFAALHERERLSRIRGAVGAPQARHTPR
jgi:P-type Ca2+ transporter type 2C